MLHNRKTSDERGCMGEGQHEDTNYALTSEGCTCVSGDILV